MLDAQLKSLTSLKIHLQSQPRISINKYIGYSISEDVRSQARAGGKKHLDRGDIPCLCRV